jgi:hypothetical protein
MQQPTWLLPVDSIERRVIFGSWPRHCVAVVVVWRKVRARALSVQTLLQTLRILSKTKTSLASSCQPPNNSWTEIEALYSLRCRCLGLESNLKYIQTPKLDPNRQSLFHYYISIATNTGWVLSTSSKLYLIHNFTVLHTGKRYCALRARELWYHIRHWTLESCTVTPWYEFDTAFRFHPRKLDFFWKSWLYF